MPFEFLLPLSDSRSREINLYCERIHVAREWERTPFRKHFHCKLWNNYCRMREKVFSESFLRTKVASFARRLDINICSHHDVMSWKEKYWVTLSFIAFLNLNAENESEKKIRNGIPEARALKSQEWYCKNNKNFILSRPCPEAIRPLFRENFVFFFAFFFRSVTRLFCFQIHSHEKLQSIATISMIAVRGRLSMRLPLSHPLVGIPYKLKKNFIRTFSEFLGPQRERSEQTKWDLDEM